MTSTAQRLAQGAALLLVSTFLACAAPTDDDDVGSASAAIEDTTTAEDGLADPDSEDDGDAVVGDDPDEEPAEAVASAVTAAKPPAVEAFFNDPETKGNRDLEKGFEELVSQAVKGSTIHMSIFGFTRSSPAKALVKAYQRGVSVRLVLDGHNAGTNAVKILTAALPANAITLCHRGKGACIGDNIDHNKFAIFSELSDGSKAVVWQSSQNLTGHQLTAHNNSVVVRNDAKLFNGYLSYWNDLHEHKENLNYYTVVDGKDAKAYFFPRASGDTVLSILDNVRCKKDKSTIRVAMAFFVASRISVAKKLGALEKAGCDVEVLLNPDSSHISGSVVSTLRDAGVKVRKFEATGAASIIHSKYLLIDSNYDGAEVEHRKLVFTGSHNYTAGALRTNDETLIRVDDGAVFDAFEADYARIRKHTH